MRRVNAKSKAEVDERFGRDWYRVLKDDDGSYLLFDTWLEYRDYAERASKVRLVRCLAVNHLTGEPKATAVLDIHGTPKPVKKTASTVLFELNGDQFWCTLQDWRNRKQTGRIVVA